MNLLKPANMANANRRTALTTLNQIMIKDLIVEKSDESKSSTDSL